jgi:hypothetical protein
MPELISAGPSGLVPTPARVAIAEATPDLEALFGFAREAELRVRSLRMIIDDHMVTARGAQTVRHEILLRHPGRARVTSRRSLEPLSREYDVWLSDGETVTTFRAADRVASVRPARSQVVGTNGPGLPGFAQQYEPLTALPTGSLADTFIHPHGLFRNVLVTGPLAEVGLREVAGHEAIVVRAEHPRTAKVLVDRPDRSVEVGIGRDIGFVLYLTERVGGTVTRQAEVTSLELDPSIHDEAFVLRLPADVRMVY